jgi:hypothetical protein
LYEGGEGSARLIVDDLYIYLFNEKGYKKRKYIA